MEPDASVIADMFTVATFVAHGLASHRPHRPPGAATTTGETDSSGDAHHADSFHHPGENQRDHTKNASHDLSRHTAHLLPADAQRTPRERSTYIVTRGFYALKAPGR
jgi:hypothetical protein